MKKTKMLIPNYPKLKRSGLKKAIIHNTAGSASARQEAIRLKAQNQWMNGNAHKFIDDKECVTVVDMSLVSYNAGDWNTNCNSISYEICKSRGNKDTFLIAEQNTFKVVAEDLKKYKKSTNIIDIHRNIVPTACPHRSQQLHGSGNKCLKYFKQEVSKYMSNKNDGGGIKIVNARQLLASNGRVVLAADRALYNSIPTKKTKYTKVLKKGAYFYNGYYQYKNYKGVDSKGRKCHFVQIYDLQNMNLIGYAPIYSSDRVEQNTRSIIEYKI